jgi:hypothetical protein
MLKRIVVRRVRSYLGQPQSPLRAKATQPACVASRRSRARVIGRPLSPSSRVSRRKSCTPAGLPVLDFLHVAPVVRTRRALAMGAFFSPTSLHSFGRSGTISPVPMKRQQARSDREPAGRVGLRLRAAQTGSASVEFVCDWIGRAWARKAARVLPDHQEFDRRMASPKSSPRNQHYRASQDRERPQILFQLPA